MSLVVINAVTVSEEGRGDFEARFAARAGKVSSAPGFEAFEGWMKSGQFSSAHSRHAERGPLAAESEVWRFEVLESEYRSG